jgi:hypothetical protein
VRLDRSQLGPFLPDYKAREQRNKKSVGEIGIVPPLSDEVGEGGEVEPEQKSDEESDLPDGEPRRLGGELGTRNWLLDLQQLAQWRSFMFCLRGDVLSISEVIIVRKSKLAEGG